MTGASVWTDAVRAARLFGSRPTWFGGVCLRAAPGPVRDRWLDLLRATLPPDAPLRRVPSNIADDRLLGGIDLAATLQFGRRVYQPGLLEDGRGGVLLLAMAERITSANAARIGCAMDTAPERCSVVALDEGVGWEERAPDVLLDRVAFHVDLDAVTLRDTEIPAPIAYSPPEPRLVTDDAALEGLCLTAATLGIGSARAPLFALRVASCAAAHDGRTAMAEDDLAFAVRLVLAPRAFRIPEFGSAASPVAEATPEPGDDIAEDAPSAEPPPLQDMLIASAKAALPPGLLARLSGAVLPRGAAPKAIGRAGQARASSTHGRRIGCRRGEPKAGARLDLLETLKAALPWQRLRHPPALAPAPRIMVRRDDFRIARFRQRAQTTTVFAVDASGSSALHRLAEAKGAVELLLEDCYVRRDQVALIGFRGQTAEVLLPPTGSLLRARRCLAGLPGGGATPLAAGIDAAGALAGVVRGKGRTPVIALLTDGRANVTLGGSSSRREGEAQAMESGRRLRLAGHAVLLVDTSPRPNPFARSLANEMRASYLPLPYADSLSLSRAIRAVPAG